ncbi:PadR family transcriptional regulator PadR [Nocardioides cavernae]|uniref:PadR family transcriptional regulator PadR n=1 Tax=Nocardioides cavernae TaxID=1921566 RepID=A0A7Y9H760_9ACTN|nr:PadR family transcriptional regulator [Nocardioides cavernae]NYE38971.1 PadR family transcriptional regulator PadR [Nocardioides cavernae]
MTDAQWPPTWVRAALDLAVLASLTDGPLHGYAVAQALDGHGFGLLKGGSLYPVLGRLEEAGDVEASWVEGQGGPGRREYALTTVGRDRLEHDLAAWRALGDTLTTMSAGEMRHD